MVSSERCVRRAASRTVISCVAPMKRNYYIYYIYYNKKLKLIRHLPLAGGSHTQFVTWSPSPIVWACLHSTRLRGGAHGSGCAAADSSRPDCRGSSVVRLVGVGQPPGERGQGAGTRRARRGGLPGGLPAVGPAGGDRRGRLPPGPRRGNAAAARG